MEDKLHHVWNVVGKLHQLEHLWLGTCALSDDIFEKTHSLGFTLLDYTLMKYLFMMLQDSSDVTLLKPKPIKELDLNLRSDSGINLELPILRSCPGLTTLECAINSPPTDSDPAAFYEALKVCRKTLVHIRFSETSCSRLSRSINFDSFRPLRTLTVGGELFFSDEDRTYPNLRKNLHTKLPPSLESLKILFHPQTSAFGQIWEDIKYSSVHGPFARFEFENLVWLIEIAEHKRSHLPNLLHVGIHEIAGTVHESEHSMPLLWKSVMWDLPPALEAAFRGAGIALVLRIRGPRPGSGFIQPRPRPPPAKWPVWKD
ncbi:hypothetical protein AJ79_01647 [Helicocarpus griseus UAMH5409]|uniref:F-box domain-containing protein n=1 Tax=Helicocarpus griseus UAMH5409 TaxID=1447875 RepID=A0A2B7Y6B2_9EURO|nr:hypothetical protein AJ79_01647 [Helicocarpus griseus UAMH5409]